MAEASESVAVRSVTLRSGISRVTLYGIPHHAGIAAQFFKEIGELGINVDDIIQSVNSGGENVTMSFTVAASQTENARVASEKIAAQLDVGKVEITENLSRLRIVGMGMRSHSGVAARLLGAIAAENVNIENISTAEIVISILVPENQGELALKCVRDEFGLKDEPE